MELLWMLDKDSEPRYAVFQTQCPEGYHNGCWDWVNYFHGQVCIPNEGVEHIVENNHGYIYSSIVYS